MEEPLPAPRLPELPTGLRAGASTSRDTGATKSTASAHSQTFEGPVAKIELPRIPLHDLRHTHATILFQQDVNPKVVSELLNHVRVSFTMDVYQHVLPGMQAQAAATFGTALFGDTP